MLAITENPNLIIDDEADLERKLIGNIVENVKIYLKFYMDIYDFCVNFFKEYILSNLLYVLESIITEMRLDWVDI